MRIGECLDQRENKVFVYMNLVVLHLPLPICGRLDSFPF
jgi:hypothetical protein